MASPLKAIGKFLFGGSSAAQAPMVVTPAAEPPPPPAQNPMGSASSAKPANGPSFLGAAAPPAQRQNTASKTLLGQ